MTILRQHFRGRQVTVDNRAIGGRTSRRFIEEGRLTTILNAARAGDWLFVQFGTNDSNQTATYDDGEPYYLAPATDFKTWMQMYIDGANGRGVTPVLVTPPPRNSCRSDGVSLTSFTSYANAMKELGQTNGVAVVDLGARAVTYLNGKGRLRLGQRELFPRPRARHGRRNALPRGPARTSSPAWWIEGIRAAVSAPGRHTPSRRKNTRLAEPYLRLIEEL